jgi:hypothetical protein
MLSASTREADMQVPMTIHATSRCQQRGIRPEVVDALVTYGRRARRHGADLCFMDHAARRRARADLGPDAFARIADRLDTYLVIADDGAVVTAAKRLRRLKV